MGQMNNQVLLDRIINKHKALFGTECDYHTIFSPGRINLIGEHTDYNNGFVMPAAIDKGIYLTISKSHSESKVVSLDMQASHAFSLKEDLSPLSNGGWKNYVIGVIHQLKTAGHPIEEVNMVFGGDIPIGAGLSSSAALENAVGYGLSGLFGLGIAKSVLARYSQKAEHEFAGVRCGIMDQYASLMGAENAAILLDCASLDYREVPLSLDDYTLVLCNSNVEHNLASSEYNIRRQQCEAGVATLRQCYPEVSSLRDARPEMLTAPALVFDPVTLKRCEYVIEENQRVIAFAQALEKKDFKAAGLILYEAHAGMQQKYKITCGEIDFMVDFAKTQDAVLGARMMGGGFGGCTINLVHRQGQDQFIAELSKAYLERFDVKMTPILVEVGAGTRSI